MSESSGGSGAGPRADGTLYDRGMAVRRAVLGDAHVDRSLAGADAFTADFQTYITEHVWGALWTRPGLQRRERSLITLALLAGLGRAEELPLHVRGALHNGLTPDEIREVLLHTSAYAGVPAVNTAFAVARATLDHIATEGAPAVEVPEA
ncbi:MAG TPA: 4-carboxymuconolactone decarboxylase [Kineosporiaceae bacterium]